jgi:putative ABC transport system permease protein
MNAGRFFRALLRLLPFDFRTDYAKEIEQAFRAQCRDAREAGPVNELRVRWINIRDILTVACREHLSSLLRDTGYALRVIRRRPGFASVVVLTLALGMGANTAIFSVVHAVLLRPLPYADEDRLVHVWNTWTGQARARLSDPEYLDYAERTHTLDLAALATSAVNLSDAVEPERLLAVYATPNVFTVLGVKPLIGRGCEPRDIADRKGRIAVITYALWHRRFHDDEGILKRTLLVDSEPHVIIGVLPPGFRMPSDFGAEQQASIVLPLVLDPSAPRNRRGGHYLQAVGRLRPGVSIEAARADMQAVLQPLIREYPGEHDQGNFSIVVEPTRSELVGEARPVLVLLLGAVGVVLLIACANVANLILARGEVRRAELAVRTALGASRYRMVRQIVTETCVLFILGAVAGIAVASWTMRAILAIDQARLPRLDEVAVSVPVVAFALIMGVVSGALFGAIPAVHVSRVPLTECLAARGSTGAGRSRIRSGLVVAQVALSFVLLVGAGLLVKSFVRLQRVPSGLNARNVLTLRLSLPEVRYPGRSEVTAYFTRLLDGIRGLPGVRDAGAASGLPLAIASGDWSFDVEGRPLVGTRHHGAADWYAVTPGYFEALGVRLVSGRLPGRNDATDTEPVIFLNQTAARMVFPAGDAVGRRVRLSGKVAQPWRRITGIVGDVRHRGLDTMPIPEMYIPHAQFLHFSPGVQARAMTVVVKTHTDPLSLAAAIRGEIRRLDPEVPAAQVRSMEEVVATSVADRRLNLSLIGAFAALALLLAMVGVYGVMAYHVSEQRREIGVRLALGATASEVRAGVVGRGMRMVLMGIAIGIAVAYVASGAVVQLLFEVEPTDLTIFAAVPVLLVTAGMLACYLPARRVSRLDPAITLRAE